MPYLADFDNGETSPGSRSRQVVQGGVPPSPQTSRSVSASATRSPAAGQAQFSDSFGTVPNWERKQSQCLLRGLIGVHDNPQRRHRPSTTSHPAMANRPNSTLVPRPTLPLKTRGIIVVHLRIRVLDPSMVHRTSHIHNNPLNMAVCPLLKPSIVISRTRTGSGVI